MIYLLDASALIRYVSGSSSLSQAAKQIMDSPGQGNRLAVPTIALVEVWDVARKNRRDFVPLHAVTAAIKTKDVLVEDLTLAIVNKLSDVWKDSRDMIILATALDLQSRYGSVTIVSSDEEFRRQTLVPCVW